MNTRMIDIFLLVSAVLYSIYLRLFEAQQVIQSAIDLSVGSLHVILGLGGAVSLMCQELANVPADAARALLGLNCKLLGLRRYWRLKM